MTVLKVAIGNTDPGEERLHGASYGWVWCTELVEKSHLYPTTEQNKHANLATLICKSFSLAFWHLQCQRKSPLGCKAGACWARSTQRNSDWDSSAAQQHRNHNTQSQSSSAQAPSYEPHPEESCRVISKEEKFRGGKKERKSKFASVKGQRD